jgi:hypothetical protein
MNSKTLTFKNTLYNVIDSGDIGNGWKYVEVINKKQEFSLPRCLYYKGKSMKNLLSYTDYVNHLDVGKDFINDFVKDIFRECYPGSKNPICKVKESLMIGGGKISDKQINKFIETIKEVNPGASDQDIEEKFYEMHYKNDKDQRPVDKLKTLIVLKNEISKIENIDSIKQDDYKQYKGEYNINVNKIKELYGVLKDKENKVVLNLSDNEEEKEPENKEEEPENNESENVEEESKKVEKEPENKEEKEPENNESEKVEEESKKVEEEPENKEEEKENNESEKVDDEDSQIKENIKEILKKLSMNTRFDIDTNQISSEPSGIYIMTEDAENIDQKSILFYSKDDDLSNISYDNPNIEIKFNNNYYKLINKEGINNSKLINIMIARDIIQTKERFEEFNNNNKITSEFYNFIIDKENELGTKNTIFRNDYTEVVNKPIEEGKKEPEEGKKEPEEGKKEPEGQESEEGKKEPEEGKKEPEEGKKEPEGQESEEGKKEPEEGKKEPEEGKKEPEEGKKEPEGQESEEGKKEPEEGKKEEGNVSED